MRAPAVLLIALLAGCGGSSDLGVHAPTGANGNDPATIVQQTIDRLNRGGFPCNVSDADVKYGSGRTPQPTAFSPAALRCTVQDGQYVVSGYPSDQAEQTGYRDLMSGGNTYAISGPGFIVTSGDQAGLQQASKALQATK